MRSPNTKFALRVSAVLAGLGLGSQAIAYPLPQDFKIKFDNVEYIKVDPELGSSGITTPGGVNINNRVEDNWALFRITSIIDNSNGSVVWSSGDSGQYLSGLFWGVSVYSAAKVDNDFDGDTDDIRLHNGAASYFADGTTPVPDLDGDGAPDIGLAIFLHNSDTYATAIQNGPSALDISSTALLDKIPDYAGITDGTLQALFDITSGAASKFAFEPSSNPLPDIDVSLALNGFPTTGNGSFYANMVKPDGSGDYVPDSDAYNSPFDKLVLDGITTGIDGPRDLKGQFNFRPHPDQGNPDYGWDSNSEDPLFGKAVPEPATLSLLGIGLLGAAARSRRQILG